MSRTGISHQARAVVTGAGSGIGRAFAIELHQRGGRVVCSDINPGAAEATARTIHDDGGQALAVSCDVARLADVQQLAEIDGPVRPFARLGGEKIPRRSGPEPGSCPAADGRPRRPGPETDLAPGLCSLDGPDIAKTEVNGRAPVTIKQAVTMSVTEFKTSRKSRCGVINTSNLVEAGKEKLAGKKGALARKVTRTLSSDAQQHNSTQRLTG